MKMALKNSSANYFRKFKRLQLTFQVVIDKDDTHIATTRLRLAEHAANQPRPAA
jgi:hypothetical protein